MLEKIFKNKTRYRYVKQTKAKMSAVNVCPFAGCECEFKGQKTLYNHYSRKHCDNDKTSRDLYDAWARQPAKKKTVKVEPEQAPVQSQAEIEEIVDKLENEIEDLENVIGDMRDDVDCDNEDEEWTDKQYAFHRKQCERRIKPISKQLTKKRLELEQYIEHYKKLTEEMKLGLLQLINETIPCSVSPDPSMLPIPSFVQSSMDLIDADILTENETEVNIDVEIETETKPTCDYDQELIECCLTMHEGGFMKAYRMLKRGDASYAVNPKDDLMDTKDHLELVFNALCDAWFDYTRCDNYDDTHDGMFNDEADWLDVCGLLITNENKKEFY
jgi:hypothetical protein